MAKYIKRPVEIEAIQWLGNYCDLQDIYKFCDKCYLGQDMAEIIIETLEGDMVATEGDYIIKGVKGEFYPCKPDIFEMTYEAVDK